SHAGKSLFVAALCKIFSRMGFKVAPFKAQNMSLNSFITKDGKEVAIAQAFQAEAAGVEVDVRMNPILLKPKGNYTSQLVVMGKAIKDVSAMEYYKEIHWLKDVVKRAFYDLSQEYELVIIEGAGGMAEINLYDRDLANIGIARIANPDVYLIGDIERGGVFSSIYGTYKLLPNDVSRLVKGFVINKLRGYEGLLTSGTQQLEKLMNVKCLGIIPYLNFPLPSEDSLSIEDWDDSNYKPIGVLKLNRISNFTDFEPLRFIGVDFVRLNNKSNLDDYEVVILPGTKDSIADLKALKGSGIVEKIRKVVGKIPIIGICGGYQILGKEMIDKGVEHDFVKVKGLGLLDAITTFDEYRKITVQTKKRVTGDAVIVDAIKNEYVWGYEIHKGKTVSKNPLFEDDGCYSDDGMVWGSYLHGLFWNENVVKAVCKYLGVKFQNQGMESGINKLANVVEEKVDVEFILKNACLI
ncbi:cobyric acid synthase CobQ, partial [Archaeoglobales archaeon]